MGIVSLTQDIVQWDGGGTSTLTLGSSVCQEEGRPFVEENIPVTADGLILNAVDPAVDRTQVFVDQGNRALFVGSRVQDVSTDNGEGTIVRLIPTSGIVNLA